MKRLLKVTSMTGVLTLVKLTIGFVLAKVVAVYAGPTGIAMLGQVQSLTTALNGVVSSPVTTGVVRFTAENKSAGYERCVPYWRASIQWVLVILGVILPSSILLSDQIASWLLKSEELSWIVIIIACSLPISACGTMCNSVINGFQMYRRYVVLGGISAIISGIVMLAMVVIANIQGALLAASIQSALIGMIMIVSNIRQPWLKARYLIGSTTKEARRSIAKYMLMAITSALAAPISIMTIRNLLVDSAGWESAGQWQAVWRISEVYLGVVTIALGTYYLPKLSSLTGVDAIINEVKKTAIVIMPLVTLMAFFIYIFRDFIILILFTEEFKTARELFAIQLLGDLFKILSWLFAYPMISRGASSWFIGSEIFFSLIFIILSVFLIPYMGAKGAVYAYLINYMIYSLTMILNVRKFSK